MSGEPPVTIIGNLTGDPELRYTPAGKAVANGTIASTPRTYKDGAWVDGETLFMRFSYWNEPAENLVESAKKGDRLVVTGRIKSRSYETKEGEKRTVIELEADEIGMSVRYAHAKVVKTQRKDNGGYDNRKSESRAVGNDPWGGTSTSEPGGWGNGADSDPPF